jgi:hypothetical protein
MFLLCSIRSHAENKGSWRTWNMKQDHICYRGSDREHPTIRKFQLGNNLSPSGMIEPGDETEDALKRTMSAGDAGAAQSQPTAGTDSAAAEGGEQGRPGGTPDNNDTQAPQPEPEDPVTSKKKMPSEIKFPPTPPIDNKKGKSKSGRRRYAADFAAWLFDLYGDRIRDSLK